MIETVILVFIVAKIRKYKILPILKHWSIYPILISAVTYIYLESMIWHGDYSLVKYANIYKAVYLSCFLLLAIKYNQIKIYLKGICLVFIGYILNYIAMYCNDMKMPVFISNSWWTGYAKPDMFSKALDHGDFHILGDMYTKAIPLCDTIDLGYCCISIGDILIRAFAFLIIYYSIKASNNKYNNI